MRMMDHRGMWRAAGAALVLALPLAAEAGPPPPAADHHEVVDADAYPWSAVGKLFNSIGGACTAAAIAPDKVLTAAGMYGTVISVDEKNDRVQLRLDDDGKVKVTFTKASIIRVVNDPGESA